MPGASKDAYNSTGIGGISTADRVESIVDDLERAAENFEVFYYLGGAFDALRNHGDAPLTEMERHELLTAFATVRPTLAAKVPVHVLERITDGLDAAAEHVAWCAGAEVPGDETSVADRRNRMRLGQLESFTMSLLMDAMFVDPAGRPRCLLKISENEAESLRLVAEIAARRRPGRTLVA